MRTLGNDDAKVFGEFLAELEDPIHQISLRFTFDERYQSVTDLQLEDIDFGRRIRLRRSHFHFLLLLDGLFAFSAVCDLPTAQATNPVIAASIQKGSMRKPGTSPISTRMIAVMPMARGWKKICRAISLEKSSAEAARVTIIPAAVETMSDGICVTNPSPIVIRV